MDDDRTKLSGSELMRWVVVAVVVIAGIGLFFYFAPSSQPAVPPSVQETPR
jgi:multidrug efflux pump subunit AcrA (membrane-fusion protein)